MSHLTFSSATKAQAKARIALTGPTGSGKTYTALILGTAMGKKVALIDTEHGSASKYADEFTFDTLQLSAFEPVSLVDALAVASHEGYEVVIVDSLSHFWSGTGGMLEQVDNAAKRSAASNSFAGWKEVRPMERAMVEALLAYPGHIIVTMRTKTDYVVDTDDRGRKVPRKIGLKPEQREGIEYEFDIVGDLDYDNVLVISKSRAKPLSGLVIRRPGAEFADSVLAWLNAGEPTPSVLDYQTAANSPDATYEGLRALYEEVSRRNWLDAVVLGPDNKSVTLKELIVHRGTEAKGRQQPVADDEGRQEPKGKRQGVKEKVS
jgi:hypothetical protein